MAGTPNPTFVNAFEEIDLNLSYDINDALAVSFEAINLTGEDLRTRGRTDVDYWFIQELHAALLAGGSLQVQLSASVEFGSSRYRKGAAVRSGPFSFELAADAKVVLDAPWRKSHAKPR